MLRASCGMASATLVAPMNEVAVRDPLLPPELLPAGWKGAEARDVLLAAAGLVRRLRDDAHVPALFSRYDTVMIELDGRGASGPGPW
jgi:DNA-binding transcriptional regulator PaaX